MNLENIIIVQADLPSTVDGVTHENEDGTYTIFINKSKGQKKQKEALYHELSHVVSDDFYCLENASILENKQRKSRHLKEEDIEKQFPGVSFYFHIV